MSEKFVEIQAWETLTEHMNNDEPTIVDTMPAKSWYALGQSAKEYSRNALGSKVHHAEVHEL